MTVNNALPKPRLADRVRQLRPITIGAAALSFVLLLLPIVVRLNGKPHADWQQFLGRFHPLFVHLPIGFLLLLPILEVAGRARPALREAAGFILSLSFFACLGAVTLGYLLAYGSGETGSTLTAHLWGGICLTVAVLICIFARPFWIAGAQPHIYPCLLAGVILLLSWAAHQGGSLTHGPTYLTQFMPAPLKHLPLIGTGGGASSNSVYAAHISPILESNCVSCHGDGKVKGNLRLDSYDLLMKGGKDGPAVIAGNPDRSLLLQRVTLPSDHKLFMPAEGKPPLKVEDIALLRAWIQQGASPTATSLQGFNFRVPSADLPIKPVPDYASLKPQIDAINKGQSIRLIPVSKQPSDGLILDTVDSPSTFTDAQLTTLGNFAPYIVEANLARTAITNASLDTLHKLSNLRALHLEGTAITGDGLAKLTSLSQLTYLNLSGTRVTKASLAPVEGMKNLQHLYIFDTPAQPAAALAGIAAAEKQIASQPKPAGPTDDDKQ